MLNEYISDSEIMTESIAQSLARELDTRQVIFLEGDLGAGKSVFARALIRELAKDPALTVPSPTFNLLQTYETSIGPVWHYDLYRLKDPDEMGELSWDDALTSGIVLIEWPDRLGTLKPKGMTISLVNMPGSPQLRKITVKK